MREVKVYAAAAYSLLLVAPHTAGAHFSLFYFALGLVVWTFAEYAVHRAMHDVKKLKRFHVYHHQKPLAVSGPSSAAFAFIFAGVLGCLFLFGGFHLVASMGAGLLAGYATFVYTHWALHHEPIGATHELRPLLIHHDRHHKGKRDTFGVTTTLWDQALAKKKAK